MVTDFYAKLILILYTICVLYCYTFYVLYLNECQRCSCIKSGVYPDNKMYFDYNSSTCLGICFPIFRVGYELFFKIIRKIATILLLTPTNRVQCIFIKKIEFAFVYEQRWKHKIHFFQCECALRNCWISKYYI